MTGIDQSGYFSLFILLVVLWTVPWKGCALWRAAKRNDKWWFVVFLVINLLAIPEIIYLIATRKKKDSGVSEDSPSAPTPI
ncbi:MAG: hypothetical protein HY445_02630 [Candidatus Niyogibacteria bacterium]|nr:hypothetical protein [Candidatus Niyogibacteria bacterium]